MAKVNRIINIEQKDEELIDIVQEWIGSGYEKYIQVMFGKYDIFTEEKLRAYFRDTEFSNHIMKQLSESLIFSESEYIQSTMLEFFEDSNILTPIQSDKFCDYDMNHVITLLNKYGYEHILYFIVAKIIKDCPENLEDDTILELKEFFHKYPVILVGIELTAVFMDPVFSKLRKGLDDYEDNDYYKLVELFEQGKIEEGMVYLRILYSLNKIDKEFIGDIVSGMIQTSQYDGVMIITQFLKDDKKLWSKIL